MGTMLTIKKTQALVVAYCKAHGLTFRLYGELVDTWDDEGACENVLCAGINEMDTPFIIQEDDGRVKVLKDQWTYVTTRALKSGKRLHAPAAVKQNKDDSIASAAGLFAGFFEDLSVSANADAEALREEVRCGNEDVIRSIDWTLVTPEAVLDHPEVRNLLVAYIEGFIDHVIYVNDDAE